MTPSGRTGRCAPLAPASLHPASAPAPPRRLLLSGWRRIPLSGFSKRPSETSSPPREGVRSRAQSLPGAAEGRAGRGLRRGTFKLRRAHTLTPIHTHTPRHTHTASAGSLNDLEFGRAVIYHRVSRLCGGKNRNKGQEIFPFLTLKEHGKTLQPSSSYCSNQCS